MKLITCLALASLAVAPLLAQTAVSPPYQPPKSIAEPGSIFAPENLVAWCIVPFDPKKRNSEQRADMLDRLGIKRLAYDYRAEHISSFDTEVETMKRHGIEMWIGSDVPGAHVAPVLLEAPLADVVPEPLHERHLRLETKAREGRQIAGDDLLSERLRRRRRRLPGG
jgi:hypothetical protein